MAIMCMVSAGDKSGFLGAQLQVSSVRGAAAPCRARCVRVKASTAVADEEETEAATSSSSSVAKPVPRLKSYYLEKVVPAMVDEFKYTNKMQVPKLEKVVVNCGSGEAAQNAKVLESLQRDLALITGQKPVVTRAKKAVAAFKLREGVPVGAAVTLRGEVMYSFLDRLINLAFPRTRDFQGISPYSFDGQGNYSVGIKEQSVFPEIKVDTIDKERGMDVAICTTAANDKEGQKLLSLLGMPFKENAPKPAKKRKNKRWNVKSFKGKSSDTKSKAKAKKKK